MLEEVEQVRRLQAQKAPDRCFQRIVRVCGVRIVPPPKVFRVEAQPAAPRVQVPLDVVLARVVEEHCPVAELFLVGHHAKDVWCQHRRRLALVAVELGHSFAPVPTARDVALVLGDHQRDAVHEKYRIFAALLDALDTVLVGRREVVPVLAGRVQTR